ncbi:MAG: glycosyltransferase [Bacteroidaceae bacterium]|nr:glycosyltransferase [Bacteroidaceae bacterium]
MKLLIEKIKLALLKRTGIAQQKKCHATWEAKGYRKIPRVTFVLQSHNKSLQICHVLTKLREYKDAEIIVIDDGSKPEHTARLVTALKGTNEFLLRANDLFENVTYDKAIRLANGQYIALMQDDDDFDGIDWVERAVALFSQHPDMVILGGKDGLDLDFVADRKWAHGGSSQTDGDFCFVTAVNRAPMWINHDLFKRYLHHINFCFAPFQFDDYELCARAWLAGLKVGWYDAGFRSLTAGGMRLYNNEFTREQSERNGHLLYNMYADRQEELRQKVNEARLTTPR